ncbi:MAG TPA: arsenate reductase ArsC [Terriglobales bacterium]|nr:arsenate reductase ArsC [Terriglobales bacterium]
MKTRVLFLCTGNSCRSQMAQGFLRAYASERFEAHSAGTNPSGINPLAVQVMNEVGIDISGQRSKHVAEYQGQDVSLVVTVCNNAKEQCPIFPGRCLREHWPFEDPAEAAGSLEHRLNVFRRVRDEIDVRVRAFVAQSPKM